MPRLNALASSSSNTPACHNKDLCKLSEDKIFIHHVVPPMWNDRPVPDFGELSRLVQLPASAKHFLAAASTFPAAASAFAETSAETNRQAELATQTTLVLSLPVCHNFPRFATSYDWIQLEISVKIFNCY